ncbi:MAG: hypothetical protein ACLQFW_00715 [Xanthobacteraceae bacterium]
MRRLLVALVLTLLTSGMSASAQDAPPISPAQLQKILKFVDTIGAKQEFPPPTALSLGVSDDPSKVLPVVVVVTDDHKVYFCRSGLDPADYFIWSRTEDKDSSYLFRTRSDFKLIRALYLHNEQFPQAVDTSSTQVKTIYKSALTALAKDLDKSSSR